MYRNPINKLFLAFLFVFCLFFLSCKIIKQLPATVKLIHYALKETRMSKKVTKKYYYQKDKFIIKNQSIYIPCIINGKQDTVLYDSGLSDYLIERVYHDSAFKRTTKFKSSTMAFSKRITFIRGLKCYDIETSWFNFHNYVGEMRYVSSDTVLSLLVCDTNKERRIDKFLGYRLFPYYKQIMLLNFSDTSIVLCDSAMSYDTVGYVRVKSSLWDNKNGSIPFVYITIDSIEYKFIFDTGSQFALSIASKNYPSHKKKDEIHMEGNLFKDVSGSFVCDTVIFQKNSNITINGLVDSLKTTVMFMKEITHNNMGLCFISGFDWILDKYRNVIYAKPLYKDITFTIKSSEYSVNIIDTSLVIIRRTLYNYPQISLFSIIDSVNGEKVTLENICEMKTLLNKPDAFTKNNIVVLPPQKQLIEEINDKKKDRNK